MYIFCKASNIADLIASIEMARNAGLPGYRDGEQFSRSESTSGKLANDIWKGAYMLVGVVDLLDSENEESQCSSAAQAAVIPTADVAVIPAAQAAVIPTADVAVIPTAQAAVIPTADVPHKFEMPLEHVMAEQSMADARSKDPIHVSSQQALCKSLKLAAAAKHKERIANAGQAGDKGPKKKKRKIQIAKRPAAAEVEEKDHKTLPEPNVAPSRPAAGSLVAAAGSSFPMDLATPKMIELYSTTLQLLPPDSWPSRKCNGDHSFTKYTIQVLLKSNSFYVQNITKERLTEVQQEYPQHFQGLHIDKKRGVSIASSKQVWRQFDGSSPVWRMNHTWMLARYLAELDETLAPEVADVIVEY